MLFTTESRFGATNARTKDTLMRIDVSRISVRASAMEYVHRWWSQDHLLPALPEGLALRILAGIIVVCIFTLFSSGSRNNFDAKQITTFPWCVPWLKSTVPFVFDGLFFFKKLAEFSPNKIVKVEIINDEIYVIQGRTDVAAFFSRPSLTVTRAYSLVLKHCFGMDQRAVDAYLADTSGSREKPIEGSTVLPNARLSYMTHENLLEGLLKSGLPSTTTTLEKNLVSSVNGLDIGRDWTTLPCLTTFFQEFLGRPLIESLFGRRLLDESPDFARDIWIYDAYIMSLARRLPRILIPKAYKVRSKLLSAVKRWQFNGKVQAHDIPERPRFQEDATWGTTFMKNRYRTLMSADRQSNDSVASANLAFMWAAITNVVPSSEMLLVHVLEDQELLAKVQTAVDELQQASQTFIDLAAIEQHPLLLSMYAETLRLNVQIHIPRTAAHHNVRLGGVMVPPDRLMIVNTMTAHMDDAVWNTKDGQYPLDAFWAERFIVKPGDASSGATKPGIDQSDKVNDCSESPMFSLNGLEGCWIPFGGGQHACPGRILARRIMLLSLTQLLSNFELRLERPVGFDSSRFGMGVRKVEGHVPFSIRRRTAKGAEIVTNK